MINLKRANLGIAVLAAAALALTACGSSKSGGGKGAADSFDAVVEAANTEGSVSLYTALPAPSYTPIVAAFTKAYPNIQVQVTQLPTGDLTTRFASEATVGKPGADVTITTDLAMYTGNPEWFNAISTKTVPNLSSLKSTFIGPDYFSTGGTPYVAIYNTTKVTNPPATWKDLTRADLLKGLTFQDPTKAAGAVLSLIENLGQLYGADFLKTIGSTVTAFFPDSASGAQSVASGQWMLSGPNGAAHAEALIVKGASIKYVIPTPVISNNYSVGVAAHGPHPNAGLVFANFLLTKEAGAAWCTGDKTVITVTDTTPSGCNAPSADTKYVDAAQGAKDKDQIIASLGIKK